MNGHGNNVGSSLTCTNQNESIHGHHVACMSVPTSDLRETQHHGITCVAIATRVSRATAFFVRWRSDQHHGNTGGALYSSGFGDLQLHGKNSPKRDVIITSSREFLKPGESSHHGMGWVPLGRMFFCAGSFWPLPSLPPNRKNPSQGYMVSL